MPVIDFAPLLPVLTTAVAAVVVGIGSVAAIKVLIPIAGKAWTTIMGFIGR